MTTEQIINKLEGNIIDNKNLNEMYSLDFTTYELVFDIQKINGVNEVVIQQLEK
jgi:hypothetical protein